MCSVQEFIKGGLSGMVGILVSHPFDTIKTNIQTGNRLQFSPKYLYRGITSPLMGVGFEKAIVFGTYGNISRYCRQQGMTEGLIQPISGAIAGFAASFIVTPVERIKILLQTNSPVSGNLFAGLTATFTREIPGFAIYFTVYEYLKYRLYTSKNLEIATGASFIFGGLSGLAAWTFIYPQDVIKTKIQANTTGQISVQKLLRQTTIRDWYRGFPLALLRAIPLHAATFATMEKLNSCYPN